jgi:hypothetical protein
MGLILVPVTRDSSSLLRDLEVVNRLLVAVRGGDFLWAKDTVSWLQKRK